AVLTVTFVLASVTLKPSITCQTAGVGVAPGATLSKPSQKNAPAQSPLGAGSWGGGCCGGGCCGGGCCGGGWAPAPLRPGTTLGAALTPRVRPYRFRGGGVVCRP